MKYFRWPIFLAGALSVLAACGGPSPPAAAPDPVTTALQALLRLGHGAGFIVHVSQGHNGPVDHSRRTAGGAAGNSNRHAAKISRGLITQRDLLRSLEKDPSGGEPVIAADGRALIVAYPGELAHTALLRLLQNDVGETRARRRAKRRNKTVGYLNR